MPPAPEQVLWQSRQSPASFTGTQTHGAGLALCKYWVARHPTEKNSSEARSTRHSGPVSLGYSHHTLTTSFKNFTQVVGIPTEINYLLSAAEQMGREVKF